MESSVKYHSLVTYFLTTTEKTARDIAWRAVLVGRYPSVFKQPHPVPIFIGTTPLLEAGEGKKKDKIFLSAPFPCI
jgi:hypothetical protein